MRCGDSVGRCCLFGETKDADLAMAWRVVWVGSFESRLITEPGMIGEKGRGATRVPASPENGVYVVVG